MAFYFATRKMYASHVHMNKGIPAETNKKQLLNGEKYVFVFIQLFFVNMINMASLLWPM